MRKLNLFGRIRGSLSTFSSSLTTRFAEKNSKPETERIQKNYRKALIAALLTSDIENPDKVLQKKGLDVYDEMEEKDTHVYSVYQTRKMAVSNIPWEIIPATQNPEDIEIAEFCFTAIDKCKGLFTEDIRQISDAIGKGFSVLEIVWQLVKSGKWKGKYGLQELVFHKQKYWRFIPAHLSKTGEPVAMYAPPASHSSNYQEIPWSKIIHYAYDSHDSMYGRAAFRPCYWFYWFKKSGWKSWIIYLNKFGQPTVIGKYPDGTKLADQNLLLAVINTIQEETGIIIPDNMAIDFLESAKNAPADYASLSDACNAEISKAILGGTQTVEEGKRGSYALSRAHSEVRQERVEADGIDVSDVIQQQLVVPLVDYNFRTENYPQFVMRYPWQKGAAAKAPEAAAPGEEFSESNHDVCHSIEYRGKLIAAFGTVFEQVRKTFDSGKDYHPVNVGPIKKVLSERFSEQQAFEIANSVKTQIEPRLSKKEELFEIFKESLDLLIKRVETKKRKIVFRKEY